MGSRATDRSAFVVTAYLTYVQIAVSIPYPGDGILSLRGMLRIGGTGYDQYGTLPGESMGGFLPAVRVDPGETVWFQVSANPAATPPVDGAFTLELFSLNDLQESIGRSGADLSACPDPTPVTPRSGVIRRSPPPAPIGAATMWTKVKVAPGAPVSIVVTSVNSGFGEPSTRPVDVMVYEQPAGVPDYYPISDVSAFGPPIATISGAVELVDGVDYAGIPGVNVNQWVARVDWSASVAQYHIRVDGDPTFVQIAVSSQGSAGPTAAISDPLDGAVYSLPTDVPPLAYTCTPGSVPISTEAVTVDGTSVSATAPLPTSVGTHTIRVVCEDANGALGEANATYTVTEQLVAPDQALVVDEDSSVTANLLTAVTVPAGETATLTAVGAASHGTVGVVGDDVTYNPAPDYTGPDQFTYTVTSSSGGTRSATVTVSVTPINDPPVAVDDTLTVNTGQSVEIDFGALRRQRRGHRRRSALGDRHLHRHAVDRWAAGLVWLVAAGVPALRRSDGWWCREHRLRRERRGGWNGHWPAADHRPGECLARHAARQVDVPRLVVHDRWSHDGAHCRPRALRAHAPRRPRPPRHRRREDCGRRAARGCCARSRAGVRPERQLHHDALPAKRSGRHWQHVGDDWYLVAAGGRQCGPAVHFPGEHHRRG